MKANGLGGAQKIPITCCSYGIDVIRGGGGEITLGPTSWAEN